MYVKLKLIKRLVKLDGMATEDQRFFEEDMF